MRGWEGRVRRGLRTRHTAALAELYDRCAPVVYGISLTVTGVARDAEQITTAVFCHAWSHPEQLGARGRLAEQLARWAIRWSTAHNHFVRTSHGDQRLPATGA